ncbi:RagB/SusD family nutrient uptake outer membrane protein [Pedobacter sp. MC2016-14]|uniref:RagB/SusD family nutrient uptake outer membrane protein n=1 Tax=Pedobacter sp. MC2016-14 TaxID=2897327 RepID=UPI001E5C5DEC|nr:RagB/SusD family nutrient uptake outer membrane protein [Pedobacter sp. MC2016-14]MCD0489513.1 RagB/SusD family nutrient uptake outer membrane protein [Pedobacter sp. MC2016-14]
MNKRLKIAFAVLISGAICTGLSSCKKDYLNVDEYLYDMTQVDSVFSNQDKLRTYINGIASYLPDEEKLWSNSWSPYQQATDENFTSWNDGSHAGIKLMLNEITPFAANTYFNNYANWYKGIRKANTVIARIEEAKGLSVTTKRQYLGEMYYLKGYFLYLLVQQYGPAVIPSDDVLDLNDDGETLSQERSSYDDCVAYIAKNMELAVGYLQPNQEALNDIYRPTSGAAMAVMSRVLLVAASPQFNGNPSYANWTRKDGSLFISNVYDNTKWGKAAAAAKRVMETGLYELFTYPKGADMDPLAPNVPTENYPNGAGGIDPYRSYKYSFIGEVPANSNREVIWCTNVNPTGSGSSLNLSTMSFLGGWNGLNLTQDLVDSYRMKDGNSITNSSTTYPYPSTAESSLSIPAAKTVSDVQLTANTSRMYNNREARFYATIGFNHSYWKGTSYTGSGAYTNLEVTYYSNGNAVPNVNQVNDYNHTGYTCIKYNHHTDNMQAAGAIRAKTFPIFRYAEILLNYAEALNEMTGSYTDPTTGITVSRNLTEIQSAFNRVRFRAGLPGLSAAELASPATIREAIKLERKIEFACEGRRYHDLRRWMDAPDAMTKPVVGMNIKASSGQKDLFYTRTILVEELTKRNWSFKMYFWPIPQVSMNKNSKLVQNPSW